MIFRVLGIKGTAIIVVVVGGYGLLSGNLGPILSGLGITTSPAYQDSTQAVVESAAEKKQVEFVSVILADTEQTWSDIFKQQGKSYAEPRLVLFRNAVKSACGLAQSATGPFYCPSDQQIYIDLAFFQQLQTKYQAPGDFAQAYVIAHEIGHHIQTLTGLSRKVHAARQKLSKAAGNKLSVKRELQADCYAGVWANHANHSRQLLEAGDLEEGLIAASAIGDDTLQKQAQGYVVVPESFTHGSSAQRVKWFKVGFSTGIMASCALFK